PDLLAQGLELVDRRRTVHVQRRQQRRAALPLQPPRQLRRRRRLTRALEPHQQDHRRRGRRELERRTAPAQQGDQLVVNDLHDLLARRDGPEHALAERTLLHPRQEVPRELVVDVGLQQDTADLPEPVLDHGLREHAALAEPAEYAVQLFAQLLEHTRYGSGSRYQSLVTYRSLRPGSRAGARAGAGAGLRLPHADDPAALRPHGNEPDRHAGQLLDPVHVV